MKKSAEIEELVTEFLDYEFICARTDKKKNENSWKVILTLVHVTKW